MSVISAKAYEGWGAACHSIMGFLGGAGSRLVFGWGSYARESRKLAAAESVQTGVNSTSTPTQPSINKIVYKACKTEV